MFRNSLLLLAVCCCFSLTADPVNLALGKKVIYAVAPDKPTDPDCSKLTDGKINLPPKADKNSANEYFDELRQDYSGSATMSDKLTVGWLSNTLAILFCLLNLLSNIFSRHNVSACSTVESYGNFAVD